VQATGTALSKTDNSTAAAQIQALFSGQGGQALVQLVTQALSGLGGSSASGQARGAADGSQSATVVSGTKTTTGGQ
jgi:hypothetical protein